MIKATEALSSVEPPADQRWWLEPSVWIMLFLGFSAGIPILLIFSSLSLWLAEAGVSRSAVTFFSWAALGYSFKFVWAPLVDRLPIPVLSRLLGRRRSWLLLSQFSIIASILLMANTDPQDSLTAVAIAAVLLGFSSATQDVVIDAFRIESAEPRLQAMLSSTYVAGYRTAMIVAGAGAIYLAQYFGSTTDHYSYDAWRLAYSCMAGAMLIGVATTFSISEPMQSRDRAYSAATSDYAKFFLVFCASILGFVAVFLITPDAPKWFDGGVQGVFGFTYGSGVLAIALAAAFFVAKASLRLNLVDRDMVNQGYVEPIQDFFARYGKLAIWVLLLVGFYRVSDIVMGVITNVFYHDLGYSKAEIASVTKVFGVVMTITGSFLGGILALRYGVMRILMLGAVLVAFTNLAFVWLAYQQPLIEYLAGVIVIDNLSQGIAIAAFIAWLSSLTNVSFTATQYAIFSSVMTLFPKLIGGFSGTLVDVMGYPNFFLLASAMGIPVIVLIYVLKDKLKLSTENAPSV
jgi:PAT family beta-lactamase induction signal transducer AmpG